jgi:hypothetical protein
MSVVVWTRGWGVWLRAIEQSFLRPARGFWHRVGKEAFPASSFAENLSPEEFASYLLLIAAHI